MNINPATAVLLASSVGDSDVTEHAAATVAHTPAHSDTTTTTAVTATAGSDFSARTTVAHSDVSEHPTATTTAAAAATLDVSDHAATTFTHSNISEHLPPLRPLDHFGFAPAIAAAPAVGAAVVQGYTVKGIEDKQPHVKHHTIAF